jgi:hypothetical protein
VRGKVADDLGGVVDVNEIQPTLRIGGNRATLSKVSQPGKSVWPVEASEPQGDSRATGVLPKQVLGFHEDAACFAARAGRSGLVDKSGLGVAPDAGGTGKDDAGRSRQSVEKPRKPADMHLVITGCRRPVETNRPEDRINSGQIGQGHRIADRCGDVTDEWPNAMLLKLSGTSR